MEPGTGYVLHRRAYRETSLIVDLLCRDAGRLRGVARGARGRRRGGDVYQPFQALHCRVSGMGGLKTIRGLQAQAAAVALAGERLFSGLYLNELMVRTLPEEQPQPEVFDAYEATLAALVDAPCVEVPLRRFELSLLELLGYGIDFRHAAESGEHLAVEGHYRYRPEIGFVPLAGAARGDDPLVMSGADIAAIAVGRWENPGVRLLGKRLTRAALAPLLGARPLRARALFRRPVAR